jgi:hypothetical protein
MEGYSRAKMEWNSMLIDEEILSTEIISCIRNKLESVVDSSISFEIFNSFARSATVKNFPGIVLAIPTHETEHIFYAMAKTSGEWRRLRPLLLSFAGPTLSNFNGQVGFAKSNDLVENYLLSKQLPFLVKITPGQLNRRSFVIEKSLSRLINTLDSLKTHVQAPPLSTGRLLAEFENYLNGDKYLSALDILSQLKSQYKIDALNATFLEVKIFEHFRRWSDICAMNSFNSLLHTRKPPAINLALIEAIYWDKFQSYDNPDKTPIELVDLYKNTIASQVRNLIQIPPPNNFSYGAKRVYVLEALSSRTENKELVAYVIKNSNIFDFELVKTVTNSGPINNFVEDLRVEINDPINSLITATDNESLYSSKHAISIINQLNSKDRETLFKSKFIKDIWDSLNSKNQGSYIPLNWLEWISYLCFEDFTSHIQVARKGLEEWPHEILQDTDWISKLITKIEVLGDTRLAFDKFLDALPLFVSWLRTDIEFPRESAKSLYESLLFNILISSRKGQSFTESGVLLVKALLSIGVTDEKSYKILLSDGLELFSSGIGLRDVDSLLDLAEETIYCPCPNIKIRNEFILKIIFLIDPISTHLDVLQKSTLKNLAINSGVDSTKYSITVDNSDVDNKLVEMLEGKHIGIYSLTESAIRQASILLSDLVPDLKISKSSDHGGTASLKNIAGQCNYLIITTTSATHAATLFIQQNRPKKLPTLYAQGRGATSIVRAITDYVKNQI